MNNSNYPIYIYGEVRGSWVKFIVFGKNEYPGRMVKIESKVVKTLTPSIKIIEDPTLPVGTEIEEKKASIGYVVTTQRIVYENGKEILRESLENSNYRVVNGVKRVGTKIVAPPIVPPGGLQEPELPSGETINN